MQVKESLQFLSAYTGTEPTPYPSVYPIDSRITKNHSPGFGPEPSPLGAFFARRLPLTAFEAASLVFLPATIVRMSRFSIRAAGATNVRHAGCHRSTPCRGPGRTPLAAYSRPRQARCSFRRSLPHYRHHALQLHQFDSPPPFHPHPVQSSPPQPP